MGAGVRAAGCCRGAVLAARHLVRERLGQQRPAGAGRSTRRLPSRRARRDAPETVSAQSTARTTISGIQEPVLRRSVLRRSKSSAEQHALHTESPRGRARPRPRSGPGVAAWNPVPLPGRSRARTPGNSLALSTAAAGLVGHLEDLAALVDHVAPRPSHGQGNAPPRAARGRGYRPTSRDRVELDRPELQKASSARSREPRRAPPARGSAARQENRRAASALAFIQRH